VIGLGSEPDQLLKIYLGDHLAAAAGGVDLARRIRGANEDDPELAAPLARICGEIEEDRETLKALADSLGVKAGITKPAAVWAAEKLGRLKLNGQLTGYSPLSRQLELEILYVGITGKMRLWRALEAGGVALPPGSDGLDFGALAERAALQRDAVGELHLIAASRALGGGPPAELEGEG
jgi:hypothetical protein